MGWGDGMSILNALSKNWLTISLFGVIAVLVSEIHFLQTEVMNLSSVIRNEYPPGFHWLHIYGTSIEVFAIHLIGYTLVFVGVLGAILSIVSWARNKRTKVENA